MLASEDDYGSAKIVDFGLSDLLDKNP